MINTQNMNKKAEHIDKKIKNIKNESKNYNQ